MYISIACRLCSRSQFRINQNTSNLLNILFCYLKDDDEGHLTAFHCVEDLMSKGKDIFLVQFVRLGVLNRIKDINETFEKEDVDKSDQSTGAVG